jgi:Reductase C-terminal
MLGDQPRPPALPSFWSDQYGLRISYVGHADEADAAVLEGDLASREFSVTYRRGGRPVAALAVGMPRRLAQLRRQIDFASDHSSHEIQEKAA